MTDLLVHPQDVKFRITLKYFDIQRVIGGKEVRLKIYCQKKRNNNSAKLYDCRIH